MLSFLQSSLREHYSHVSFTFIFDKNISASLNQHMEYVREKESMLENN